MPIVALIVGLAAVVWGAIFARRGSLLAGCGLYIIVAYVVGHEFWHAKVGPVPLTLDRLLLVGLLAAAAIQWKVGRLTLKRPVAPIGCWLGCWRCSRLALSSPGQPQSSAKGAAPGGGYLLISLCQPRSMRLLARRRSRTASGAACWLDWLFWVSICRSRRCARWRANGRSSFRATSPIRRSASTSVAPRAGAQRGQLGYLSHRMSVVRLDAAGTDGQAVAAARAHRDVAADGARRVLDVHPLDLARIGGERSGRGLVLRAAPVAMAAHAVATCTAGLVVVAISWSSVVGLEREGSAAEAHHSVDQRASFAYVSWQMFQDHPILGVGFGRFYDRKLPYLSDRRQQVELESIRGLDHHNTFLSVLVETGMVGFAAFCGVLIAWTRSRVVADDNAAAASWSRAQGVLMLGLMVNYLCSAAFHDLTLLPAQQWLLFAFAGLTVNLWQQSAAGVEVEQPASRWLAAKVNLFGMQVDRVTMEEAAIACSIGATSRGRCVPVRRDA